MNSDLDSCVYIHGLGISSYRSFSEDIQKIYPFKKINLFIGRNNSGKSNILNFLYKYYLPIFREEEIKFEDVDYHISSFQKNEIQTQFYMYAKKGWKIKLLEKYKSISQLQDKYGLIANFMEKILGSNQLIEDSYFWLSHEKNPISSQFNFMTPDLEKRIFDELGLGSNRSELQKLCLDLSSREEFNPKKQKNLASVREERKISTFDQYNKISDSPQPIGLISLLSEEGHQNANNLKILGYILGYICDFILNYSGYLDSYFDISLIPAIREIGNSGITFDEKKEFNGQGLIDGLFKLQQPDYSEQHKKGRFNKINQFLRTVTDNESAKIEIPHNKSKILVEMDGKILPLQSLGTGIHEVIILAAAATIKENQVICMEEPELHLHPLLQKKLISYLKDETNNQYFITTHSAHFLDTLTPDVVSIFHVNYENGCSIVNRVETDNHKTTVLSDLGYKPSDLLQTNCVIWVEGPSDRIYLNYWIQCFSKDLKEKIHYTIMFYGGGLLSHLSVSDAEDENDSDSEDLNDFISLREINRNTVIMCDSDRANEKDFLKPAIDRIKLEFDKGEFPGFHWITDGREVENYLNPDIVEENIKNIHHNVKKIIGKTIYDHVWKYESSKPKKDPTADKKYSNADKVKLARGIVESESYSPPSEDKFKEITNSELENSLRDWIKGLISFIHKSNGIKSNEI